jgi:hypothetical protein
MTGLLPSNEGYLVNLAVSAKGQSKEVASGCSGRSFNLRDRGLLLGVMIESSSLSSYHHKVLTAE